MTMAGGEGGWNAGPYIYTYIVFMIYYSFRSKTRVYTDGQRVRVNRFAWRVSGCGLLLFMQ